MPCYDTKADEHRKYSQEELRLSTSMLCRMCKAFQEVGLHLDADIREWWNVHQMLDADRYIRERAHKEAQLAHKEQQVIELLEEIRAMKE